MGVGGVLEHAVGLGGGAEQDFLRPSAEMTAGASHTRPLLQAAARAAAALPYPSCCLNLSMLVAGTGVGAKTGAKTAK